MEGHGQGSIARLNVPQRSIVASKISEGIASLRVSVLGTLPTAPKFDFVKNVEIPVYIIHHGPTPEDYEILFDFDLFIAEQHSGILSRPQLRLWAGRNDFARSKFARNLRATFAEQFDLVRAELAAEKRGWLSRISLFDIGGSLFSLSTSFVSTVLLMLATSTGRAAIMEVQRLMSDTMIGRSLRRKDSRQRLEDKITEKQAAIDAALLNMTVTLHRDLYIYAYRGHGAGDMTGIDFQAWPLPAFISQRMA